MAITLTQARHYYELGMITGLSMIRGSKPGTWHLVIEGKNGLIWQLADARGRLAEFKTLDTAIRTAEFTGIRFSTLSISVQQSIIHRTPCEESSKASIGTRKMITSCGQSLY